MLFLTTKGAAGPMTIDFWKQGGRRKLTPDDKTPENNETQDCGDVTGINPLPGATLLFAVAFAVVITTVISRVIVIIVWL